MKNWARLAVAATVFIFHTPAFADRLGDAETALRNGQYQRAINLFDEAIANDRLNKDDLVYAHYNLGLLRLRTKRMRVALRHFNYVIQNAPRDAEAYDSRGQTHTRLGNFDAAIADFSVAVRIRPNYAKAFHDRGKAYERKGNKSKALADYETALTLKTDYVKARTAHDRLTREAANIRAGTTHRVRRIAGERFQDCNTCPQMVVIPTGRFRMGDMYGGGHVASKTQVPVHDVKIDYSFAVGVYEVTQEEWVSVMRSNPSQFQDRRNPVEQVSWEDAKAFLEKLNRKTNKKYRLLSESEWEYVARAGTTTRYSWGDTASHEYANYGKDGCCGGLAQGKDRWENTSPVGSFGANSFGIFDMHGNVWEWVEEGASLAWQ